MLAKAGRGEIPHPVFPDRPLRQDELISFAHGSFYGPDWDFLAEVLALLDAGEPVPVDPPQEEPPPETVSLPHLGIFCNDWSLPIDDYADFASHLRRAARIAPDMRYSPPASILPLECLGSPKRIANPQHPLKVRGSATPLLLLNALHDPATGYNWATNAARQLGDEAVLL